MVESAKPKLDDPISNSIAAGQDLEELPSHLVFEQLRRQYADGDESQKLALAYALARYGSVEVDFLIKQVPSVHSDEVENLVDALSRARSDSLDAIRASVTRAKVNRNWGLQQRLAVLALHLGDDSIALDMCELKPNPIQRTVFIHDLATWHGDISRLTTLAPDIDRPATRAGLCLGVGRIPKDDFTTETKRAWQNVFRNLYLNDYDSGVHSAAGWALRNWQVQLPEIAATKNPPKGRAWYINSVGMTMPRIPHGSFFREDDSIRDSTSRAEDHEMRPTRQKVTLRRSFLIGDREVSVAQYQRMLDDRDFPDSEKPLGFPGADLENSPTDDHPVQRVNWNDAVQFCNWLSYKEGYSSCYRRTGKTWSVGGSDYEEWALIPAADGYRLPTEAEWEYACRARTVTDFVCGDDERYLVHYSVYGANRTSVCGRKLPNGWGLFDVHGNVFEWCQDWYALYSDQDQVVDPVGPPGHPMLRRVLRGQAFGTQPRALRSDYRDSHPHTVRGGNDGFRVVRTVAN